MNLNLTMKFEPEIKQTHSIKMKFYHSTHVSETIQSCKTVSEINPTHYNYLTHQKLVRCPMVFNFLVKFDILFYGFQTN